jgi:hypothetical protein
MQTPTPVANLLTFIFPVLLGSCPLPLSAQARPWTKINPEPACDCRLQMEPVLTMGGDERRSGAVVSEPGYLVRWGSRWALTHTARPTSVSLFDEQGRFISELGRRGEGPGELGSAGRLALLGDTLVVMDAVLYRASYFAPDGTFLRHMTLPAWGAGDVLAVPDGLLMASTLRRPPHDGQPFLRVHANGDVRSFGADTPAVRRDMPHALQRVIHPTTDGGFWSARRTDYVLEQWDSAGRRVRQLRREAEWFLPHGRAGVNGRVKPNPAINAFWVDANGYLWVVISVASRDWQSALVEKTGPQGRRMIGATSDNALFDTIIEVIDPANARIVARGSIDRRAIHASGNGLLVFYEESDIGVPRIDVWRPRVVRREGTGGA